MSPHPYVDAKPHQLWRSAMVHTALQDIDPAVSIPFRILPGERVATAGSCFAQHLGRRLGDGGLDLLITESAHPILPPETARALGYGVYTARFGNIYTARQMLQLLRRAYGRFTPAEKPWTGPGSRVFDPFRPAIQPDGFATRREYEADLAQHFAAVRKMFETADVLIFTLGLTECWASREDGAIFPVCPGVVAGEFDPALHVFLNLGVDDVVADLEAMLEEARAINPALRLVLTVSPVPLAATAEPRHVWTSTTLSKAVLRVAADRMARKPGAAYFPSYEVVTSPAARGDYFNADLRTVTEAGVDHVMRLFFRHLAADCGRALASAPRPVSEAETFLKDARAATDQICEEAKLDPVEPDATG